LDIRKAKKQKAELVYNFAQMNNKSQLSEDNCTVENRRDRNLTFDKKEIQKLLGKEE
jgi:hypothetical protein